MKKIVTTIIIILFALCSLSIQAQGDRSTSRRSSSAQMAKQNRTNNKSDSTRVDSVQIYGWKISPRFGERTIVQRDTNFINFHQTTLVDGKDIAVGYLGNIGSPSQSKIFFNRPEPLPFVFLNAFDYWYKKPEDHVFLNTKRPYSNIFYQTSGGDEDGEQRLMTELSSNFGKKVNIGIDFDYLYARGHYFSLYNKQFSYNIYGSYIGDRYQMHAYFANNYFNNSENGGLANSKNGAVKWYQYITETKEAKDKDNYKGETLDIPTSINRTWNKLQGRRMYVTNRYNLGDDTEMVWINDSTQVERKKANYVPLASILFTTNYTDQRRRITSYDTHFDGIKTIWDGAEIIYNDNYNGFYQQDQDDFMSYYSFKNTLAFAMNEGFREWTKFGLTVFAEYDKREYSIPKINGKDEGFNYPGVQGREGETILNVGGALSKSKGKYLKYNAFAEKSFGGDYKKDFRLEGDITTMLYFKEKQMSVKANAYIKNARPSFFERKFSSKYWTWDRDLKEVRRLYIGGEINIPFVNAKLSGGVENITNHVYFEEGSTPKQWTDNIQITALRLDHKFKYGIFNWENSAVYQKSSEDKIIPLPDLSLYSNMYIETKIAKVLGVQLGVDAHYHTKYYAPGYNPLTMQFFNQRIGSGEDWEIGGFPIANAYLNLNLKYTRFFVMVYNIGQGFSDGNSFSLYKYAVNPLIFKMGLSWKFNN